MSADPQLPKIKSNLHPRSKHREPYDFNKLCQILPALSKFVRPNLYKNDSIDFADPIAVKTLNEALLKEYYGITHWELPEGFLCPPIPGRADYIHHAADLMRNHNYGKIPIGKKICVVDIGVGASCIYPILGIAEYGWSFIATEVNQQSFDAAYSNIKTNQLEDLIDLRWQKNPKDIFYGAIKRDEFFDLSMCNPPFHNSKQQAIDGSKRKVQNLKRIKTDNPILNFGGQDHELWCEGGERRFLKDMMKESKRYGHNCFWFTSLVSKEAYLNTAYTQLESLDAQRIKIIPMGQGNKSSRLIAWTFLNASEQKDWASKRWSLKNEKS